MRPVKVMEGSAMKRYIGSLATVLFFGASILGMGETARAQQQQAPPDSQQPMEIPPQYPTRYPAQYPPQYPPQQAGPQQGGPQQQAQTDPGAAPVSYIRGDVSTQHSDSSEWSEIGRAS